MSNKSSEQGLTRITANSYKNKAQLHKDWKIWTRHNFNKGWADMSYSTDIYTTQSTDIFMATEIWAIDVTTMWPTIPKAAINSIALERNLTFNLLDPNQPKPNTQHFMLHFEQINQRLNFGTISPITSRDYLHLFKLHILYTKLNKQHEHQD